MNKSTCTSRNIVYWSSIIVGANCFALLILDNIEYYYRHKNVFFIVMIILALLNDTAWYIANIFLFEILLFASIFILSWTIFGLFLLLVMKLFLIGLGHLMSMCFGMPWNVWVIIFLGCILIYALYLMPIITQNR